MVSNPYLSIIENLKRAKTDPDLLGALDTLYLHDVQLL